MTIETKYNIGQEVWIIFCKNGVAGAVKCLVTDIKIKHYKSRTFTSYGLITTTENTNECLVAEYEIPDRYNEEFIFPTKEELLKSL